MPQVFRKQFLHGLVSRIVVGRIRKSIESERAVEACQRAVDDPAIASDPTALQERYAALEAARADVDRLYARWAELEAKQS